MTERDDPFLSRWARRKAEARRGAPREEPARDAVRAPAGAGARSAADAVPLPTVQDVRAGAGPVPAADVSPPAGAEPALPTLGDVARLTRDSDFSPFMRAGVDPGVKNAALKKLFSDPHFNVMDGLDVYIDDYSQPDPIPAAMLRKLNQAASLGLFESEQAGGQQDTEPAQDGAPLDASAAPERASTSATTPADGAPAPAAPHGATAASDPSHDDVPRLSPSA